MKTKQATLSAPGPGIRPAELHREFASLMKREVQSIHESTGFSLTVTDVIRILAFSLLICAALLMNFEGSAPWQILCTIEALQLVYPALYSLLKQLNN